MKISKSYHIAGQDIRVVVGKPEDHECLRMKKGGTYSGDCDIRTGTITINADLPPAEQASTLFHEFWHVLDLVHGLELTEKQVKRLERSWFALLADNFEIRNKRRKS